jgi:ATP-binding cassette subfamily C protein
MGSGMIQLLTRCAAFARGVADYAGRRAIGATVFVALGALLEGFGIMLLIPLLATLMNGGGALPWPDGLPNPFAGLDPDQSLALILSVFAVIMVLRLGVLWRRDTLLAALQVGFVESHRRVIARGLAAARWESLTRLGHARVTHILSADIQRCGAGVHFLMQGSVALFMLAMQIVLAFLLSPPLAALAVGLMAIGALVLSLLLKRALGAGAQVSQSNMAVMIGLGRFLGGMKMAMSQNLQGRFVAAFERDLATSAERQIAFMGQQTMMRGVWALLGAGVGAAVLLIGHAVLGLSAPVLIALLLVLARISGPASTLQNGLQQIAYSLPAWEALKSLEHDLGQARVERAERISETPPTGTVVLDAVVYRHRTDAHEASGGLHGVSLTIEPGEVIGLSGASGAGKTTLADLLAGLLAPQAGKITVGGRALTADLAPAWRDRVAYVAQDPVLFNDTVRANLSWVGPDIDEAAIRHAISLVGAEALIARLPQGLDTVVGENGALISGGERQRLALARAILRRPSLLILDEATSAIDVAGERAVLLRLRELTPRPTIVMIAHRAETLSLCERIVTVVEGRITGDHTDQNFTLGSAA